MRFVATRRAEEAPSFPPLAALLADPSRIGKSNVKQQNLSMRMGMRRFAHLTNEFSKKLENHLHMLSLYFVHYNFVRVHKRLRMTPAMTVGVADKLHDMEWLLTTDGIRGFTRFEGGTVLVVLNGLRLLADPIRRDAKG